MFSSYSIYLFLFVTCRNETEMPFHSVCSMPEISSLLLSVVIVNMRNIIFLLYFMPKNTCVGVWRLCCEDSFCVVRVRDTTKDVLILLIIFVFRHFEQFSVRVIWLFLVHHWLMWRQWCFMHTAFFLLFLDIIRQVIIGNFHNFISVQRTYFKIDLVDLSLNIFVQIVRNFRQ